MLEIYFYTSSNWSSLFMYMMIFIIFFKEYYLFNLGDITAALKNSLKESSSLSLYKLELFIILYQVLEFLTPIWLSYDFVETLQVHYRLNSRPIYHSWCWLKHQIWLYGGREEWGEKGEGFSGTCVKDTWTKPKGARIEGGRWGCLVCRVVGEKWRQLY